MQYASQVGIHDFHTSGGFPETPQSYVSYPQSIFGSWQGPSCSGINRKNEIVCFYLKIIISLIESESSYRS